MGAWIYSSKGGELPDNNFRPLSKFYGLKPSDANFKDFQNNLQPYDIGLPPEDMQSVSSYGLLNTKALFTTLFIQPGIPVNRSDFLGENLTLDFNKGRSEYLKHLRDIAQKSGLGLSINDNQWPIRLFVNNTAGLTETFSNTVESNPLVSLFQDTKLGSLAKTAGSFIRNSRLATSRNNALTNLVDASGDLAKGIVHDLMGNKAGAMLDNGVNMLTAISSGNKFDFFKRWSGSGFSGNYSFNLRLFNPKPYNDRYHLELIVKPLLYLTALTTPIGTIIGGSDFGYYEPFYVRVWSYGLFEIKYGIIKSLTIIKGGSDNSIAMNNRPFIVDISIDFEPLLSVKVMDALHDGNKKIKHRRPDNSLAFWIGVLGKQTDPSKGAWSNTNNQSNLKTTAANNSSNISNLTNRNGIINRNSNPVPSNTYNAMTANLPS